MAGQKSRWAEAPVSVERRRTRNRAWIIAVVAAAFVAVLMALALMGSGIAR